MMTAIELVNRLVNVADTLVDDRRVQIGDLALRALKEEIKAAGMQLSESEYMVDYEARCLIDCIAELSYARTDGDKRREERALMYINSFRTFLRMDLNRAQRKAATS